MKRHDPSRSTGGKKTADPKARRKVVNLSCLRSRA
jgi:hypothetical protein